MIEPLTFRNLTALETLYLNDNAITALPTGMLDDCGALNYLYACTYTSYASNTSRNLFNNRLTALPTGLLQRSTDLQFLYHHHCSWNDTHVMYTGPLA